MIKLNINDFAHLDIDDNGDISYHYLNDSVKPLSNKNADIINVLIENGLKYENFITSTEIVEILDSKNISGHDKETVKKAIQRIRKDVFWRDAIESSPRGYRIKYTKVSDNSSDTNSNTEMPISESSENVDVVKVQPVEAQKTTNTFTERTAAYISNFIANKGQIRTFYYEATRHNVSEVYYPVTLTNKDDNSVVNVSVKKLYESNERHRYIISGQIGTGKSLLARSLALEAASNFSTYRITPLLFDLAAFKESNDSLFDILKKEYESYIPDNEPNLVETMISLVGHSDFSTICQQGSLLLLLDGLDEIHPDLKVSFHSKLKDFLRSYGSNTIIIFSRPTGKFVEFESFNVLHIKLLSLKQASELIDQLVEPYGQEEKQVFKDNVLERYDITHETNDLFYTPLFISMLSSKFKKQPYLYKNIQLRDSIEGFIRYVTCEDQSTQHRRSSKRNVTPTTLRFELERFCYYLVVNDILAFDVGDLNSFHSQIEDYHEYAEDFLDDLCRVYGLVKFVDGRYRFIDDLIVEYFYVSYVFSYDNYLSSVRKTIEQSCYYSSDNILDILFAMNKRYMARNIYCTYMDDYVGGEKSYESFLIDHFHKLFYYAGQGEYKVSNTPKNDIYQHLVSDLEIEQDKDNLQFPAIEDYKLRAVYKLSKANAKKLGKSEGLIEDIYCDKKILKSLKIKPVGYVYSFNVHNVIYGHDENSKIIKNILMSDSFPLRIEYEKAMIVCGNIEDGECDL